MQRRCALRNGTYVTGIPGRRRSAGGTSRDGSVRAAPPRLPPPPPARPIPFGCGGGVTRLSGPVPTPACGSAAGTSRRGHPRSSTPRVSRGAAGRRPGADTAGTEAEKRTPTHRPHKDRVPEVKQRRNESGRLLLEQRLAAGNRHPRNPEIGDAGDEFPGGGLLPVVEWVVPRRAP